ILKPYTKVTQSSSKVYFTYKLFFTSHS
ncbi:hypothetical protein CCACVL1_02914, partial [Corchorus capsularis]